MPTFTAEHYDKAIETADGAIEIAKNDQLIQGLYISSEINPDLQAAGAICGGHQACMIGTLWIAHGVKSKRDQWNKWELPGTGSGSEIRKFANRRPALRLALDTFNEVCREKIASGDYPLDEYDSEDAFSEPAEQFFEVHLDPEKHDINAEVLDVARKAKRRLQARKRRLSRNTAAPIKPGR